MPTVDPYPHTPARDRRECTCAADIHGRQEQTIRIPAVRAAPRPRAAAARAPRRDLKPLGAVVFLPPGTPGAGLWTDACGAYIDRRGYRLAAVCSAWADVIRMVFDGVADVVVVGRREHLPRDRTPRVDVVAEQTDPTPANRRRPNRIA